MYVEDFLAKAAERFGRRKELVGIGLHKESEGFTGNIDSPAIACTNTDAVRRRAQLTTSGKLKCFACLEREAINWDGDFG